MLHLKKLNAKFFSITLLSDFSVTTLLFNIWAYFSLPKPNLHVYSIKVLHLIYGWMSVT